LDSIVYGISVPPLFYVRNTFFSGSRYWPYLTPYWLNLISIGGLLSNWTDLSVIWVKDSIHGRALNERMDRSTLYFRLSVIWLALLLAGLIFALLQ
jgi:hypothetical protein